MTRRLLLVVAALAALLLSPVAASPAGGQADPYGVTPLTGVAQIEVGDQHACARLTTGRARCWGDNGAHRLGHSGIADQGVPGVVTGVGGTGQLTQIAQLGLGAEHSCARLTTGQVRCWGENFERQLGTGDQNDGGPFVVENRSGNGPLTGVSAIAAGNDHTCAIVTGGQVRCWGHNANGELGDGSTQPRTRPVIVLDVNGAAPLTGATQITAGTDYTCVRLNTGQARCWGSNTAGQLGRGNNSSRPRPVVVRNASGTAALTGVVQIAAGSSTTCVRLNDDSARCFGSGFNGLLGNDNDDDSVLPVRVRSVSGPGFLTGVKNITVGSIHACAIVAGGQARCWGDGNNSALGTGNVSDRDRPGVVRNVADTGALLGATQISAGADFTCVRLNNGQARCMGQDSSGQLGHANAGPSDTPVVVRVP